jgi:uncharacterized protein YjbI with pentapeptide repeats
LTGIKLRGNNLNGGNFTDQNLTNAYFSGTTLTGADFTGAAIRGANFSNNGGTGITLAQLYSTKSYQDHDLTGIGLDGNDLSGGNFAGQNLTDANFSRGSLTDADLNGAEIRGANFSRDPYVGGTGLTLAQLYSTASYQAHDLSRVNLRHNNLAGGNFVGQNLSNVDLFAATMAGADFREAKFTDVVLIAADLTGANFVAQNLTNTDFSGATLTNADFTDADVRGARFETYYYDGVSQSFTGTGITLDQLYSTSSYQAHDLNGINLASNNLAYGNFAGQNLTNADFRYAMVAGASLNQANVTNANFELAALTDVDLAGAEIRGINLGFTGITLHQLYSTSSYHSHDLSGINFAYNDLAGGNFAGQNLTNTEFNGATLTGADFNGADVRGASFPVAYDCGFDGCKELGRLTLAQLYSTASYQARDLNGISLTNSDLAGANFAGQNLTNADFGAAVLSDANFRDANLTNVRFFVTSTVCFPYGGGCGVFPHYATLAGADLTAADARGAIGLQEALNNSGATTTNLIRYDGHIRGLDLDTGGAFVVRDYDGRPTRIGQFGDTLVPLSPIPITIDQHLTIGPGGTLRMVFEADDWDSAISFAPGIPVTLGGTLELTFADDVNLASQLGRTLKIFDWTGVTPTGAFAVSSPYAWDVSNLYTTGEVALTAIPEPSAMQLFGCALCAFVEIGRRRIRFFKFS